MIPSRLTLQGFLSYRDSATLDFESFDLACIAGFNGAGKSSLLDAMTWALFGQARRRDDAIINVHAKAAEVVFDFFYEDNFYRVQRSKTRDRTAMLDFFIRDAAGNWKPLTEKSIRETEIRLQQILRLDYETFINASFFLQGKADQFATQKPADRKRILSAILGLEVWERYREGAASRRKNAEKELSMEDGSLKEVEAELAEEDERKARLAQLENDLKQQSIRRKDKEVLWEALNRSAAALEEQRRLLEDRRKLLENGQARLTEAEERLASLTAEREEVESRLSRSDEITAAYEIWQNQREELRRWDEVAVHFRVHEQKRTKPLTTIASERSRLEEQKRALLNQSSELEIEKKQLPELTARLEDLKKQIEDLHRRLETRAAMENRLQEVLEQGARAKSENSHLERKGKDLNERINRLDKATGSECPLCGQPLSPENRNRLIAEINIEVDNLRDQYRANQELCIQSEDLKKECEIQLAGLQQTEVELRALVRTEEQAALQENTLRRKLEDWEKSCQVRLNEIERILTREEFAPEARAELAGVDQALKELGYDSAAHDAARLAEQAGRWSEMEIRELEKAGAALEPLKRGIEDQEQRVKAERTALANHQKDFDEAAARFAADSTSLPDLSQVEAELRALKEEENQIRDQRASANQKVQVLEKQRQRREEINARRAELTLDISRLKMLEKAFGKDGVPALLIEEALPDIEKHANDILDSLTNGGMSVGFRTQRDFKDKSRDDQRETLDIVISDAAGPREYEMFSGGESFRVNFAIRLALSRVLAQRAGARLQTLVIDEGFGSQDQEGRQRLIETINQVRPDFAKILVITHLAELIDAFPARIIVDKTDKGSTVRVENT